MTKHNEDCDVLLKVRQTRRYKETPSCSLVLCHHRLESFGTAWSALHLQEVCILHPHLCLESKSSSLAAPLASQWTGLRHLPLFLGHSLPICWHWWCLNCPLLLFSRQEAEPGKEGWQSYRAFPKNVQDTLRKMPPNISLHDKVCTRHLSFYLLCSVLHNCKDKNTELSAWSHCRFPITLCPESQGKTLYVTQQVFPVRTKCIV